MSSTPPAEAFVAFALRADYEDTYAGGLIVADDKDFDVKAELDAGDGVIVTANPGVIQALTDYPALKRVAVPEDRLPKEQDDNGPTVKELKARAAELELATSGTKADLIERIEAAEAAALADADTDSDDSTDTDQGAGDGATD